MKFRTIFFGLLVCFAGLVNANNQHVHPQATAGDRTMLPVNAKWAGYCEIEIINNSYQDVRVYGTFDDGLPMRSFNVYSFEAPHYISLYYYGYCHAGMDIYIDSFNGWNIYSGYTPRSVTLTVVPYLANQAKAELRAR